MFGRSVGARPPQSGDWGGHRRTIGAGVEGRRGPSRHRLRPV